MLLTIPTRTHLDAIVGKHDFGVKIVKFPGLLLRFGDFPTNVPNIFPFLQIFPIFPNYVERLPGEYDFTTSLFESPRIFYGKQEKVIQRQKLAPEIDLFIEDLE